MGNHHSNKQPSNSRSNLSHRTTPNNHQSALSSQQSQTKRQTSSQSDLSDDVQQRNSAAAPPPESFSQLSSFPLHPNSDDENQTVVSEPPSRAQCDSTDVIDPGSRVIPNPSLPCYARRLNDFSFHPAHGDFELPSSLEIAPQSENPPQDYDDSQHHHRHALKANHSFGGCRMNGQISSASTIAANPNLGGLWQPPGRFAEFNARRQRAEHGEPCSALHARGEVLSIRNPCINEDEERTPRIIGGSDTTSSGEGHQAGAFRSQITDEQQDRRGEQSSGKNASYGDGSNSSTMKFEAPPFKRLGSDHRKRIHSNAASSVPALGEDSRLLQGSHAGFHGASVVALNQHHFDYPLDNTSAQLQHGHFHNPYVRQRPGRLPATFCSATAPSGAITTITATCASGSLQSQNGQDSAYRATSHHRRVGFNGANAIAVNRAGSTDLPASDEVLSTSHRTGTGAASENKNGLELKRTRLRSTSASRIEIFLKPVPKGYAVKSYRNGDRYEGELVRGKRDGYGLMFMSNGEVYAGQWSQDVRNGRGLQFYAPWGRYEGDFRLDLRCGWGMLVMRRHGTFFGQFLNNKKHGRGILIHPRGEVFAEWWNQGKLTKRVWLRELLAYRRKSRELSHQDLQALHPSYTLSPQQQSSMLSIQQQLTPIIRTLPSDTSQSLTSRSISSQDSQAMSTTSRQITVSPLSERGRQPIPLVTRLPSSSTTSPSIIPPTNMIGYQSFQSSTLPPQNVRRSSSLEDSSNHHTVLSNASHGPPNNEPLLRTSSLILSDQSHPHCPNPLRVPSPSPLCHFTSSTSAPNLHKLSHPSIPNHRWKNPHIAPTTDYTTSPNKPQSAIYNFRDIGHLGPIAESIDSSPGSTNNTTNQSPLLSLSNDHPSPPDPQTMPVEIPSRFPAEEVERVNHGVNHELNHGVDHEVEREVNHELEHEDNHEGDHEPTTVQLEVEENQSENKAESLVTKEHGSPLKFKLSHREVDRFIPHFDSVVSTAASSTLQTPMYTSGPSSSQYTGSTCLSSKKGQDGTSSQRPCLCHACSRRHPSNSVMSAFVCAVGRRSEGLQSRNEFNVERSLSRRNSYQMRRRLGSDSNFASSPSVVRLSTCSDSSLPQLPERVSFDVDRGSMTARLLRSSGMNDHESSDLHQMTTGIERCSSMPERLISDVASSSSSSSDEKNSSSQSSTESESGHQEQNQAEKNAARSSSQTGSQTTATSETDVRVCVDAVENVRLPAKRYTDVETSLHGSIRQPQLGTPLQKASVSQSVPLREGNTIPETVYQNTRHQQGDHLETHSAYKDAAEGQKFNCGTSRIASEKKLGFQHSNSLQQINSALQPIRETNDIKRQQQTGMVSSIISSASTAIDHNTLPELTKWSVEDVAEFMTCLGLSHLAVVFQRNQIGGEELINLTEDDLENELRIRDATHRQIVVQAAQALSRCEAKRRFQGQPWVVVLRYLRDLFRECLISSAALRRCRLVGEGGFGIVYKGLWGGDAEVAIKAFRVSAFTALPPQKGPTLKKDESQEIVVQSKSQMERQLSVHKELNGGSQFSEQQAIECERGKHQQRVAEKKRQHEERIAERQRQRLALMLLDLADEAKVLMSLRHPNVTRFWGVCLDTERQWLVTQYVPGGSLFSLIHSSRGVLLDSTRITKIALGICSGMAYVHSKGLLHCDLKSPNILLDENLEPKICDFGLALRTLDCPTAATRGRIGTPQWMAPEVLRGAEYSKAADVYSFGVILWEMLSRRVPHANMTLNHVIAAVGWGNHRLDAVYHCPDALSRMMKRCLHRISTQRPTFEQLVEEFSILVDSDELESDTSRLLTKPFRKLKESTRRTLNSVEGMLFGPPL